MNDLDLSSISKFTVTNYKNVVSGVAHRKSRNLVRYTIKLWIFAAAH
jgi:hypothetical protein